MYSRNRFQYEAATGRATLPIVSLITLIAWIIPSVGHWEQLASLLGAGATAYLLIETDTRFALIRTRTTLPSCLFLLFYTALTFIHSWSVFHLLPICFMGMLYSLFQSYESPYASTSIFHAFLWLSLGSLALPPLAWLVPFLYIHMVALRSFGLKTFFAGLVGFATPYWMWLGYGLYQGQIQALTAHLSSLVQFSPILYSASNLLEWGSWGVILLLSLFFAIRYLTNSYKDKVQTRITLQCMLLMALWLHLLIALQPHLLKALLPLTLIPMSFTGGHLFAITFNRLTRILFPATLGVCLILFLFNLWMHSFNF